MEAAAEKSRSATVLELQAWTYYYNLYKTTSWGNLLSDLHVSTNSKCLIGISDAFSALCQLRVSVIFPTCSLYPNKSVHTLHYTRVSE